MADHDHCPSVSDLADLVHGAVPAPETHRLGQHVLTCPGCVDTLSGIAGGDTLIQQLRDQQQGGPSTEVDRMIDSLAQRLNARKDDTPPTVETVAGTLGSSDPYEGAHVGGYRLERLIGRGGMGMVFQAIDTELARPVALKVMRPDLAADSAARLRFLREARAAAAVRNDHIVTIYRVGQDGDNPFLAMEFLTGECLNAMLARESRLNVSEALRITREAATGLAAAHARGLIHRDIKPANLWLEAGSGRVKILDFGLARSAELQGNLTASGQIVGTPQFMAPEQARGLTVDARCDLFSLGAVIYCMLGGQPPFPGADVLAVLASLAVDEPKPLQELNPQVPAAVAALVKSLLAKRPEDRPESAAKVIEAIRTIESTIDTLPPATPVPAIKNDPIAPRQKSLRRTWLVATAAAVLGALSMGGYLWLHPKQAAAKQESVAAKPAIVAATAGRPIKVGILHSLSGTLADSGNAVTEATLLAIDEINHEGGLLGRPVQAVVRDGQSDWPRFGRKAEQLISNDKVCTIFGCWSSAARKMVKPVVEKHNHLLIYPLQFEGLEMSSNIVYNGATPNQQIIPAVQYCYAFMKKRRFFLVGSDYVFPRTADAIIRDLLADLGAEVVGEAYLPLGSMDVDAIVSKILQSQPDVILNTINGDSNRAFFRALRAAGVKSTKVPTISFSVAEPELRQLDLKDVVGDYAAWNYFQSIDCPQNHAFVDHFRARFGPQRVTSDPMEAAYLGVHLWAQAVKKAGSDNAAAIRDAMRDQRFDAPEGLVRIDPETLQTWKTVRLGKILQGGQFEVVWRSGQPVRPEPYPPSRSHAQWESFLHNLYSGWAGHWANPEAR